MFSPRSQSWRRKGAGSPFRRFLRDDRGAFAVIFGILAIVLVATAGAVVDFTTIQQARTRAQDALDSASLGLQPQIFLDGTTDELLKAQAQNLLAERLIGTNVTGTIAAVATDTTLGTLRLDADIVVPTAFVSLIGYDSVTARLVSEATRKQLNLEVVMVLDNSNSMSSQNRMTHLKTAAKCAMNILFNSDCDSTATATANDKVWIGIVPFTMQVKVGTNFANASWMDRTGTVTSHAGRGVATFSNNITNDNFDNNDTYSSGSVFNGTVDRIGLFNQISNVSWGGCVEARKHPFDTNDDQPVPGTDTMFTPLFAPDEPDSGGFNNNYLSDTPASCNYSSPNNCTYVQTVTGCNNSGSSCSGSTSYSSTLTGAKAPSSCTCPTGGTYTQTLTGANNNKTRKRTWVCTFSYAPVGLSSRELQERLCKYNGSAASGVSQSSVKGPNADCPTNAVTPLTADKPTVLSALNALAPQGGTNIHAGTIWGLRVLSPTEPLTEGLPYNPANAKVLIVMTDGENTAYKSNNMNGTTYYSYYGFPFNQRMGSTTFTDAELEAEMDARTVASCNSAKAEGIKVYTIGLATANTSDQTKVENMLINCSSGPGYYYFPTSPSQLTSVFKEIANQLAQLRLAK